MCKVHVIAERISARLLIWDLFEQCSYIHLCSMWCHALEYEACEVTSRWNVVHVLRNPLVMEVEGSQSECRRRLATLRKRKRRDTRTAEERELNSLPNKKARSEESPQAR